MRPPLYLIPHGYVDTQLHTRRDVLHYLMRLPFSRTLGCFFSS